MKIIVLVIFLTLSSVNCFTQCVFGNCKNGKGQYQYENGDIYIGSFQNENKSGSGIMFYWNGNIYDGEWLNDRKQGDGKYFYANGDQFHGSFYNDDKHGIGTYYWSSGGCRLNEKYQYGQHISGSGEYKDRCNKVQRPLKSSYVAEVDSVFMVLNPNGLYEIRVILNDVLSILFYLDTGSSEVFITPDVALTLIRTGTIRDNDWLPGKYYTFADGTVAESYRFNLQTVTIGNKTITNVSAAIGPSIDGMMLLGQNLFSRLGKVQIDYDNHVLIISE